MSCAKKAFLLMGLMVLGVVDLACDEAVEKKMSAESLALISEDQEVRGGGDDQIILCATFCQWCDETAGPLCWPGYCNVEKDPCFPLSIKLIQCLHSHQLCAPVGTEETTICLQEDWEFRTCKDLLPTCGDGYISWGGGETCDDANTASGDGCSADCQNEALDNP